MVVVAFLFMTFVEVERHILWQEGVALIMLYVLFVIVVLNIRMLEISVRHITFFSFDGSFFCFYIRTDIYVNYNFQRIIKLVKMPSIEKDFIDYFNTFGKAFGWGDMPTTVIAILYIEPDPVAMEEIVKRTGYSLASISNMMKMLETMGFVTRIKKPKTKKAYFYMEKDIVKLNKQKLVIAYETGIKPAKDILPQIIKKYENKAKDAQAQKKLEIVRDYYRQMLEFEKILKHMIEDIDRISSSTKQGNSL